MCVLGGQGISNADWRCTPRCPTVVTIADARAEAPAARPSALTERKARNKNEIHLLSNLVALEWVQIRADQRGGRGALGLRMGREGHGRAGEGRAEEARR